MVSFTMAPINTPLQTIRTTTTTSTSLLCPCRRQTSSTPPPNFSRSSSSKTAPTAACSCRLSFLTDSLPVRTSSLYSTSYLPTPSHAYNLRSSSSSHFPSTNASNPSSSSSSFSTAHSSSPPFSFTTTSTTVDCDDNAMDYYPFPLEDTALDQSTSNALGVNFTQSDYSNHNISNNTWFGNYLNNSTHHPIETLLNSDIAAKNNARQEQSQQALLDSNFNAIPHNGQYNNNNINDTDTSTNNTFENTFFQQLQGPNRSKKLHTNNMPSSSSPQTPRDGAALFSSFNTTGGIMNNSKSAAAEFDFDMLAASFLNDQVAAFESAPASTYGNTNNSKITENFFANLPLIGSPLGFAASNLNSSSPPSAPLLQNAFRTFSNANNMVDGSQSAQAHFPPRSTSMSSSNSSSISPNLASPAFDASVGNFPFSFAAAPTTTSTTGNNNNGFNASYTSPNYSGIDTPALVMDDGNDLATSLTTSPMWGQLDLGSISLFPQQQQQQLANVTLQSNTPSFQQQQSNHLSTISPKELDLPLPEKNSNINASFNDQVRPASFASSNKKKRVRDSPAFGDDDDDEDEDGGDEVEATSASTKKARRSTSSAPASAAATAHFNGTRHTSSAPLPLDAPTQPRTYKGPESKTSKRAVPAAAARKVAAIKAQAEMMKQQQQARRSVSVAAAGDDEAALGNGGDIIDDEQVEEVIEMSIEAKRRQNTIAARRSRQRKAEHLAGLEETIRNLTERVAAMENEKMVWMMRAIAAGWSEDSRSL